MDAQLRVKHDVAALQDALTDLDRWTREKKKAGKKTGGKGRAEGNKVLPPVRGRVAVEESGESARSVTETSAGGGAGLGAVPVKAGKASHTYDNYKSKWDAFDYDKALEEADGTATSVNHTQGNGTSGAPRLHPSLTHPSSSSSTPGSAFVPPVPASSEAQSVGTATMSNEELAESLRVEGNAAYAKGDYNRAIDLYEESVRNNSSSSAAYGNLAMAHIKLHAWEPAEAAATRALENDPEHVKSLQRRALAREKLGRGDAALVDLERAAGLQPKSKTISTDLRAAIESAAQREGLPALDQMEWTRIENITCEWLPEEVGKGRGNEASSSSSPVDDGDFTVQEERLVVPHSVSSGGKLKGQKQSSSVESIAQKAAGAVAIVEESARRGSQQAPPRSAVEFENRWKILKEDRVAKGALLRLMEPSELPGIFKNSLSADLLFSIVATLVEGMECDNVGWTIRFLEELARVPRFAMTCMLLGRAKTEQLAQLWQSAKTRSLLGDDDDACRGVTSIYKFMKV